jgi:acyl carrier protein
VTASTREEISSKLTDYVREQFLGDSEISELSPDTPLLEWGVLNSMNTSILLTWIRVELGVAVPPTHITGRNFHSLESITDMIVELSPQAA